jgi:phage terminase small subunit
MSKKKTDKDQWKGKVLVHTDESPSLLPQQEQFVSIYVANGGNADAAAKAAGYANAANLLTNHKIRQAVELKRDLEIKTTGATQAWQVMQGLLTDPAAPAQVRFQAARWTLEASGHGLSAIAAAIHMGNAGKKGQHEMTVSELQEMVDKAREQLTSMKQVVTAVVKTQNAIEIKPDRTPLP